MRKKPRPPLMRRAGFQVLHESGRVEGGNFFSEDTMKAEYVDGSENTEGSTLDDWAFLGYVIGVPVIVIAVFFNDFLALFK